MFSAHWAPVVLHQLQHKEDAYRAAHPSWMDLEVAPDAESGHQPGPLVPRCRWNSRHCGGYCPTCLGHHTPAYHSSNDRSLGRNAESCNFSALVMAQRAARLILNTLAMTPCFNVGRTVGHLSNGSCIQSALMVPVNIRMLLSL